MPASGMSLTCCSARGLCPVSWSVPTQPQPQRRPTCQSRPQGSLSSQAAAAARWLPAPVGVVRVCIRCVTSRLAAGTTERLPHSPCPQPRRHWPQRDPPVREPGVMPRLQAVLLSNAHGDDLDHTRIPPLVRRCGVWPRQLQRRQWLPWLHGGVRRVRERCCAVLLCARRECLPPGKSAGCPPHGFAADEGCDGASWQSWW